jgi:hypothetical protein
MALILIVRKSDLIFKDTKNQAVKFRFVDK